MAKMRENVLLQDSNRMLRAEKDSAEAKVRELESRVSALVAEVEPLKASNRQSVAELDAARHAKESAELDLKHWQGRVKTLLDKHEQVDPVEHQRLKTSEEAAQAKAKESAAAADGFKAKLASALKWEQKYNAAHSVST